MSRNVFTGVVVLALVAGSPIGFARYKVHAALDNYKEAIEAGVKSMNMRYFLGHRFEFWPRDEMKIKTYLKNAGLNDIKTECLTWYDKFKNGGELFDRIIDTEHKLSLVRIARITTQILRAVQHCHENGIVNRDIKSENVLFKTKDPESQIKVIDFGLSAIYSDHDNLHARVGTVFYMSPEVRSLSVEFENIFLFY